MKRNVSEERKSVYLTIIKNLVFIGIIVAIGIGCTTAKSNIGNTNKAVSKNDTVRIANDSLQYEVIITDPGFTSWLASTAKPRGFYSQSYLENKNLFWVAEYNRRVLDPFRYNPNLYLMRIDYESRVNYGYEVNYLLYNYLLFFQREYRQKL